MDSRRSNFAADEDAWIRQKHQGLLQEYLVLQKEFVSKKRKLQEAKQRKETLGDELRFLRRRRDLLLKMESLKFDRDQQLTQPYNPGADMSNEANARDCIVNKASSENFGSKSELMWTKSQEQKAGEEADLEPLRVGKKSKDLFSSKKRAEKRKISWQDQQLALNV